MSARYLPFHNTRYFQHSEKQIHQKLRLLFISPTFSRSNNPYYLKSNISARPNYLLAANNFKPHGLSQTPYILDTLEPMRPRYFQDPQQNTPPLKPLSPPPWTPLICWLEAKLPKSEGGVQVQVKKIYFADVLKREAAVKLTRRPTCADHKLHQTICTYIRERLQLK